VAEAKRFYWCGHPAKLGMRDVTDEDGNMLRLRYGDSIELTPKQQEHYAHYIKSGQFNTELTDPPRRSKRVKGTRGKPTPSGRKY